MTQPNETATNETTTNETTTNETTTNETTTNYHVAYDENFQDVLKGIAEDFNNIMEAQETATQSENSAKDAIVDKLKPSIDDGGFGVTDSDVLAPSLQLDGKAVSLAHTLPIEDKARLKVTAKGCTADVIMALMVTDLYWQSLGSKIYNNWLLDHKARQRLSRTDRAILNTAKEDETNFRRFLARNLKDSSPRTVKSPEEKLMSTFEKMLGLGETKKGNAIPSMFSECTELDIKNGFTMDDLETEMMATFTKFFIPLAKK